MTDIDEPLKEVPFSSFTTPLGDPKVIDYILYRTSVNGILHRMHIIPRAADRRWNKALREAEKEEDNEPEHGLYGEEVPTPEE